MELEITFQCPQCSTWASKTVEKNSLTCPACGKWFLLFEKAFESLSPCPLCQNEHLYKQKDFNRKLGILILFIGIVGSYHTYGLSLIVVTLLDWWLYSKVNDVGICYRCQSQFRHKKLVSELPPFNLALHDYYENLRRFKKENS